MDIELKEKYKKLHKEYCEVNHNLNKLEYFFNTSGKHYNKSESIEALKKIKEYMEELYNKEEELRKESKLAQIKFQESCEHEIVIKAPNGKYCACCGRPIFKDDYKPIYEIEIPIDTHLVGYEALMDDKKKYLVKYIRDEVDKYLFDNEKLEESFEYLQENSKAIVRKLK